VAGDADPETGYSVLVDGTQQTIGGTAVALLWAGLIVLLNASLGKPVGFLLHWKRLTGRRSVARGAARLAGRSRAGAHHRRRVVG
jgi:hypothetical protein